MGRKKKKNVEKYKAKKFTLFSKFDQGIRLDNESWYSVCPEEVASHIAQRCSCDVIIDAFCGSGGNSIQFGLTCEKVIAIDNDPVKIRNARHNARIYGVEDKIDFILGDFFDIMSMGLVGDVVYLAPPWGGPTYNKRKFLSLNLLPLDGMRVFHTARQASDNIVYNLPKNVEQSDIQALIGPSELVEVEYNYLDDIIKCITAYFGDLCKN